MSISSSWVIKQIFRIFLCNSQIITPRCCGCPDELLPSAFGLGQQFIESSTIPRGDSFDRCTERCEIVVYCLHEKTLGSSGINSDAPNSNSFVDHGNISISNVFIGVILSMNFAVLCIYLKMSNTFIYSSCKRSTPKTTGKIFKTSKFADLGPDSIVFDAPHKTIP